MSTGLQFGSYRGLGQVGQLNGVVVHTGARTNSFVHILQFHKGRGGQGVLFLLSCFGHNLRTIYTKRRGVRRGTLGFVLYGSVGHLVTTFNFGRVGSLYFGVGLG